MFHATTRKVCVRLFFFRLQVVVVVFFGLFWSFATTTEFFFCRIEVYTYHHHIHIRNTRKTKHWKKMQNNLLAHGACVVLSCVTWKTCVHNMWNVMFFVRINRLRLRFDFLFTHSSLVLQSISVYNSNDRVRCKSQRIQFKIHWENAASIRFWFRWFTHFSIWNHFTVFALKPNPHKSGPK